MQPRHRFEADTKIVQEEDLVRWAQKPEVRELRADTDEKEDVRIEWSAVIP